MLRQTLRTATQSRVLYNLCQSLNCPAQTSRGRILQSAGSAVLLRVACRRVSPVAQPTTLQSLLGRGRGAPSLIPSPHVAPLKAIFPLSRNIIFHFILFSTLLSSIAALSSPPSSPARLTYHALLEHAHGWLRPTAAGRGCR
jgi:hypothetical protein